MAEYTIANNIVAQHALVRLHLETLAKLTSYMNTLH